MLPQTPPSPPSRYRLVLIDPPWKYRARGSRLAPSYAGQGRAEAHYEPMTDEAIAEYLASVSPDLETDALALMWITNSALLEARHLPLLAALGMTAAQVLPWVKTTASGAVRIGGGNYTRGCSEHLILAQRGQTGLSVDDVSDNLLTLAGEVPLPAAGEHSLILARRGRAAKLVRNRGIAGLLVGPPAERRHSSKPESQYELAEALVAGPYLELFARRARAGWDARGDQLGLPVPGPCPRSVQAATDAQAPVEQNSRALTPAA
jgi:N6-adenosine-specific RNA methylase IME4